MREFSFVVVTDSHVDVRDERSDTCWWNRMLLTLSCKWSRSAAEAYVYSVFPGHKHAAEPRLPQGNTGKFVDWSAEPL